MKSWNLTINVVRHRYFNVSSLPKIFLVLLEILGFMVSFNVTFIFLIDYN